MTDEFDDFITEEGEGEGEGSASRRPFLIAVAALASVFILAAVCSAVILMARGSTPVDNGQVAGIKTRNAIVAVTNEAVTQTIAAMETEAAQPTETPEVTATNTPLPVPTNTPRPTRTPVVQQPDEEGGEAATANFSGTTVFAADSGDSTPTPIGALGGGSSTTTPDESLPQTGIDTWSAVIAALFLIVILFAARRLRSS